MSRTQKPGILVLSLHPAVDRTYEVPNWHDTVVRGRQVLVEAGGKGVNVARTLGRLGERVTCLGFVGRDEARLFRTTLATDHVRGRLIIVEAPTRQNITLISPRSDRETHIIDAPMRVGPDEKLAFHRALERYVRAGVQVIFTGSFPRGIRAGDFVRWLRLCRKRGAATHVDTQGAMLRRALLARPSLIKPNLQELGELAGKSLKTPQEAIEVAVDLLDRTDRVLLSLGRDGAVLISADGRWHAREATHSNLVHTVGCGDALLAGFVSAEMIGRSPSEALRFAVACGSACARSHAACVPCAGVVRRLMRRVRVRTLCDTAR